MLLASQDHRDAAFRAVEELPGIKVATIRAGNRMHPVPQGRIIDLGFDIGAHMAKQRNAGLIIVATMAPACLALKVSLSKVTVLPTPSRSATPWNALPKPSETASWNELPGA